ncbi:MAG: hypothetical protein WDN24_00530 [Sphingomonas sp.]
MSLNVTQIPLHTHTAQMRAVSGAPNTDNPTQASFGTFPTSAPIYNTGAAPSAAMAANTAGTMPVGSNLPIPVLSPYLTMQYCIFTTGIFPAGADGLPRQGGLGPPCHRLDAARRAAR